MSKIVWNVVEIFIAKYEYASETRGDFIRRRAKDYAKATKDANARLDRCVGVTDYTKIRMRRPSWKSAYQWAVYKGHKHVHIFIYHSVTTSDGLIFSPYYNTEKSSFLFASLSN